MNSTDFEKRLKPLPTLLHMEFAVVATLGDKTMFGQDLMLAMSWHQHAITSYQLLYRLVAKGYIKGRMVKVGPTGERHNYKKYKATKLGRSLVAEARHFYRYS